MWWSNGSGTMTLRINKYDALQCSHSGDCELDVIEVMNKPYLRQQLALLSADEIRNYLLECGAWTLEDLQNGELNVKRLVWSACCDLADEL